MYRVRGRLLLLVGRCFRLLGWRLRFIRILTILLVCRLPLKWGLRLRVMFVRLLCRMCVVIFGRIVLLCRLGCGCGRVLRRLCLCGRLIGCSCLTRAVVVRGRIWRCVFILIVIRWRMMIRLVCRLWVTRRPGVRCWRRMVCRRVGRCGRCSCFVGCWRRLVMDLRCLARCRWLLMRCRIRMFRVMWRVWCRTWGKGRCRLRL